MNALQRCLWCECGKSKLFKVFLLSQNFNKTRYNITAYQIHKSAVEKPIFQPKRIAIVSKITRYEYEKRTNPDLKEEKLQAMLEARGSDYYRILQRYKTHSNNLNRIIEALQQRDIETRVVSRTEYDQDVVQWADTVLSAGGDGTFLLAASKVKDRSKPVIGVNTDPERSEGYLCLPKSSCRHFSEVLDLLMHGKFRWSWRHRIRVTMSGKHDYDEPVSLRDREQSLSIQPEDRFTEHHQEHELYHNIAFVKPEKPERVLPVLALNEVFIGEILSARVSYYEISLDDSTPVKQKSSGMTISTGTGSTSWLLNINQICAQDVEDILKIASDVGNLNIPYDNLSLIRKVVNQYNNSLKFDADDPYMAYTIRDPIVNGIFQVTSNKGFVKKVKIKSRMWDACLVIDGGVSVKYNDGATATLEMFEEDALRTVKLDGVHGKGVLESGT